MKQLISVLLVLILLIGLPACGAATPAEPTAGEDQLTDGDNVVMMSPVAGG